MNSTTTRIYQHLSDTRHWRSGEKIGQELSISRTAVAKHIGQLREHGCIIQASPRRGYLLKSAPATPHPFIVTPLLKTEFIGKPLIYLDKTDSTNRVAARHAQNGASEGAVIIAGSQTAGRGRFQRPWHSPPESNLYFSIILRPDCPPARISQLPILAAAALLPVLDRCFDNGKSTLSIKWPNDILAAGRKICGILCECEVEMDVAHYVILGIGMNVNNAVFPNVISRTATSLFLETGKTRAAARLLADILNHFEPVYRQWCAARDMTALMPLLTERCFLRDRDIVVNSAGGSLHGRFSRILPDGQMEMHTATGISAVNSGDVTLAERGKL